jgi:hypothetical protein
MKMQIRILESMSEEFQKNGISNREVDYKKNRIGA